MFLKTDHPDKVPCDSGPFNISNMGEKVMNLKFTLGVLVNSKGLIKKFDCKGNQLQTEESKTSSTTALV